MRLYGRTIFRPRAGFAKLAIGRLRLQAVHAHPENRLRIALVELMRDFAVCIRSFGPRPVVNDAKIPPVFPRGWCWSIR